MANSLSKTIQAENLWKPRHLLSYQMFHCCIRSRLYVLIIIADIAGTVRQLQNAAGDRI